MKMILFNFRVNFENSKKITQMLYENNINTKKIKN